MRKGSYQDLTGRKFGRLKVTAYAEHRKDHAYFRCRCACGKEAVVSGVRLRNGHTRSCGCLMNRPEMVGKKFHRLLVLSYAGKDKKRKLLWNCRCDCGKLLVVRGPSLRNGNTKSCGCIAPSHIIDMVGWRSGHLEVVEFARMNRQNNAMWRCHCHRCGSEKVVAGGHLRRRAIRSCGCLRGETRFRRYTYRGNTYRSLPELIFTFAMECASIKFEYEPKVFHIEMAGKQRLYTPDFYLPAHDLWVEIKSEPSHASVAKFKEFAKEHRAIIVYQADMENLLNIKFHQIYTAAGDKRRRSIFYKKYLVDQPDLFFLRG